MRGKHFIVIVALLCSGGLLFGQANTGTLNGTVSDPSGAAVAGATVTATNLHTGLGVRTKTTGAGIYVIPNLPSGTYSVTVSMVGFKTFQQTGVAVQIANTTNLDIRLELGKVSQKVTVSGGAPLLQTTSSEVGTIVPNALISSLPLEVSGTIRNPIQFVELVPGFTGSVCNQPTDNACDAFQLSGGQISSQDTLVDGLSISLVSPNTQMNYGVSPEAVREFKTLQFNFPPEYGYTGDGIINLTLKSGTNELHGSAYDFLQNAALDANSWVNDTSGVAKQVNTQNDFGASIGGPVILPKIYNGRNKTFFFGDYEGFRYHVGSSSVTSFPPTAFRNGDFTYDLQQGIQLYDPTTHVPIAGDILTSDPNYHPSAIMGRIYSYMPVTNSGVTNNSIVSSTSFTTANLFDVKVDQKISDKQRVSASFDFDNTNNGVTTSLDPLFGGLTPQNTRYARFGDYYIFSPTLFNQFMAGFSRRYRGEISTSLGGNFPTKLGLTGVANTTFPCLDFLSSPYGASGTNCGDSEFADNVYQLADSLSWIHGRHNAMFGGEYRGLQFNVRRLTYSAGSFSFAPAETGLPGVPNTGDAVASADFGLVDQAELVYGNFSGIRYQDNDVFAQDTFQIRPHLTLNYGLRYDLTVPATEAFNRFSDVNPALPNPGAGNILGAYTYFGSGPGRNGQTRPQNIYTKDFAPRLGFAYSINRNTVIRAGYGIYYEPLKEDGYADYDSAGFFNTQLLTSGHGTPFQIDSGMPHIVPPSGPLTPQGQNGNSNVILVPPNVMPGMIQNWNFDVERQVGKNLMVRAAYVGSRGTFLPTLNIIPNQVNPKYLSLGSELSMNASCLTAGTCPLAAAEGIHLPYAGFTGNLNQALRPYPQYGDFQMEDNSFSPDREGNSIYHALQVSVTKRLSSGLSFLVSYTVSKDLTNAEDMGTGIGGWTGGANSFIGQNSYDRAAEMSQSEFDTPQALSLSYVYQLPIGSGKHLLNKANPIVNRLVSGWYVSGIQTYNSGFPTAVYESCGGTAELLLFAGCEFTGLARANLVAGVPETNRSSSYQPANTPFFNPKAFSVAPAFTFGNAGRTLSHAREFSNLNEDLTLGKKTYLYGERVGIDFRAEFFNAFNRHIYSLGNNNLSSGPFLPVGAPGCPGPFACGFGAVTSASGPRDIQFGLKVTF